jgi:hypothetical protein
MSKIDLVRQAIAELGRDVSPAEIIAWVQQKHGVTLKSKIVSTYKGEVLRASGATASVPRVAPRIVTPPESGAALETVRRFLAVVDEIGVVRAKALLAVVR